MIRERIFLACLAAGAAIGASLLASPDADASPLSYLQSLNAHGVTITNTADALGVGYAVCQALGTTNGADVARNLYLRSDIPTPEMAATVVIVAVEELCPAMDHRGKGFVA